MTIYRLRDHREVWLAADGAPKPPTPKQLAKINALPGVLRPLAADEVTVLGILLVNDQPFKDGRRVIRTSALKPIAKLMPGVKVAMNHDVYSRDGARAVGRAFDADVVKDGETSWVLVWWYSLNGGLTGELVREVVGGLTTEASIAMLASVCECSICGGNWGMCKHYEQAGSKVGGKRCLAELDGIERVIEFSFVFSGMVEGTRFLVAASENGEAVEAVDLDELEKGLGKPVVVPPAVYEAKDLNRMIEALSSIDLDVTQRMKLGEILAAKATPDDPWAWLRGSQSAA